MAKRVQHTAFDTLHPAVPAVYVVLTLALTMFSMEPLLLCCSLAGALAYACRVRGPRACWDLLRWQLPLMALVVLVNPLFVREGTTPLFSLFGRTVFAESVAFGCALGALLAATVLWFAVASDLLPFDQVLALLGGRLPTLALMLSMMLRLVPSLVRRGEEIASVQDVALGCFGGFGGESSAGGAAFGEANPGASPFSAGSRRLSATASGPAGAPLSLARRRLRQSTVLMGWTLEDSLKTADSMRARGWGAAPRRTAYRRQRFSRVDAAAVAALLLAGVFCLSEAFCLTARFSFYPVMSGPAAWWRYLPCLLWMMLPAAAHVLEARRFR